RSVHGWVEQHQSIRPGAHARVLPRLVEPIKNSRTHRKMTAGRTSSSRNPVRVDMQLRKMRAHPANGGLRVSHGLGRSRVMAAGAAIVSDNRYHSALCQVLGLRCELRHGSIRPAPTEEEHDRRTLIRPCGFEYVQAQLALTCFFVDVRGGPVDGFRLRDCGL